MARIVRILLLAGLVLTWGNAAFATVIWGNYSGTNVDFLGVQETSVFGDPEPLYGAPLVVGDQLLFFPANYSASAAGAGGIDQTGAQLQATLMATNGTFLTTVSVSEFGDTTLTGVGTAATGSFAGIGGSITVLEAGGIPIAPVIIPIPVDQIVFGLPGDSGITNWSLTTTIDIGALVPTATKAFFSFDNNLVASSEAGTTASIQKKVLNGPSIMISVPEPAALGLLVAAGLALVLRRRG